MAHRTTLTLQDDVHAALRDRAARDGRPLVEVVNDVLRGGLAAASACEPATPVTLATFSGNVLIDVVSTSAALEAAEGPRHR